MRLYLLILFVFLSVGLLAQEDISDEQEDLIENFIQAIESDGEFDFAFIFEELMYLAEHPMNLNKLSYEDLKKLYILNEIQIDDILSHREKFGDFIEIHELQSIPSLSLADINHIKPFINVSSNSNSQLSVQEMISGAQHTIYAKWRRVLETPKGYTDEASENSRFLGDPNRLYNRYQMRYGNKLKFGVSMEKDEGEPIFTEGQKGFDYYSAHLHFIDLNPMVKDLLIGDFSVSLGQGLILHNDFGSGKSTYVMDIKKGGRTLKSYTSLNETNFYRGIGLSLRLTDKISLTAFGSKKDIDANQSTVPNIDGFDFFTSILNNGLHRSINERNKINAVNELAFGAKLGYAKRRFKLNYNFLYSEFDKQFERRSSFANQFKFRGDQLINQSIDYTYKYRNLNFFGETAISDNNAFSHLHGVLIGLDKLADLSILYRNYAKDYQSLFSNSFGETLGTNNEKGLYVGFRIRPTRQITVSAYADQWSHPWVRFRSDGPTRGREYLVKLEYDVRRKANFYVQYKYEQKEQNSSNPEFKTDRLVPLRIEKLRANLSYNLNESLRLRSRIELSRFQEETQNDLGYLTYMDLIINPKRSKLSLNGRVAYFDTPGFDTRIYTYESDLQYEFFIPFFADQGWRYYANFKYRYSPKLTFELRAAQTKYLDIDSIGSGNDAITGNSKTQIKAQFRIKL